MSRKKQTCKETKSQTGMGQTPATNKSIPSHVFQDFRQKIQTLIPLFLELEVFSLLQMIHLFIFITYFNWCMKNDLTVPVVVQFLHRENIKI